MLIINLFTTIDVCPVPIRSDKGLLYVCLSECIRRREEYYAIESVFDMVMPKISASLLLLIEYLV